MTSSSLAFFRGILGAMFLFIVAKIQKKQINHHIGIRKILCLVITGAVMGVNWMFLFEAYNYTTVATATLCYYMQPTIVILLSPLFFKETITAKKWICVILSIIGMIFVSGLIESGIPPLSESKGILFGIGAALFYAAVVIMNKNFPDLMLMKKPSFSFCLQLSFLSRICS